MIGNKFAGAKELSCHVYYGFVIRSVAMKSSFGNRLLRAALSLGFLVGLLTCLVAEGSLQPQAGTSQRLNVADALGFNYSDAILVDQVETGALEDFGAAFEDSGEMLRVDIHQRTFGIDQAGIGAKVVLKSVRNTHPNISPPLLV
jgi:hypothetical protein